MMLKIGTRASQLALAQTAWVKKEIEGRHPNMEVTVVRIRTRGDKILNSPLSKIGGKGLFVKEIEDALLAGEVDLAVHSMKDVPADLPAGLRLSAFPPREDPRDALVSARDRALEELPPGGAVGTGSLRRAAQLLALRPDLRVVPLRGNVDTRLKKLASEGLQAVILAAAGLRRLGLAHRISHTLPPSRILPAVGQGALGLESREGDPLVEDLVRFLNHEETALTVRAERAFLKRLGGGCQVPIAGHARLVDEALILQGVVAELDGSRIIRQEGSGPLQDPEGLGVTLAERLLAAGADRILARVYGDAPPGRPPEHP